MKTEADETYRPAGFTKKEKETKEVDETYRPAGFTRKEKDIKTEPQTITGSQEAFSSFRRANISKP